MKFLFYSITLFYFSACSPQQAERPYSSLDIITTEQRIISPLAISSDASTLLRSSLEDFNYLVMEASNECEHFARESVGDGVTQDERGKAQWSFLAYSSVIANSDELYSAGAHITQRCGTEEVEAYSKFFAYAKKSNLKIDSGVLYRLFDDNASAESNPALVSLLNERLISAWLDSNKNGSCHPIIKSYKKSPFQINEIAFGLGLQGIIASVVETSENQGCFPPLIVPYDELRPLLSETHAEILGLSFLK
jgi:hypothetical protein